MNGRFVGEGFEDQLARRSATWIASSACRASSLDGILRLNTYLSDASQYPAFKEIRAEFLKAPYRPRPRSSSASSSRACSARSSESPSAERFREPERDAGA